MPNLPRVQWLKAIVVLLLFPSLVLADQLILKDGTVLEGTVIRQKDCYWVRTTDGRARIVRFDQVQLPPGQEARGSERETRNGGGNSGGPVVSRGTNPSSAFLGVKRQADAVETPLAAVAFWQKFVDSEPSPADRAAALVELEKWRKLADDGAERINGRWIGGADRRMLVTKAVALTEEAADLIAQNQTLAAIRKLQEAVRIYPNSYQAIFSLGYLSLLAKDEMDAIRYFEQGLRVRPNSSVALNNLGIALLAKRDYTRAIDLLYRAVEIEDNRTLAQNLYNVVDAAPDRIRETPRFKAAEEASKILAGKYGIKENTRKFALIPPPRKSDHPEDALLAGIRSSGTGFFIREDGLILTNRHVVEGGQALLVLLPGNIRKSAEIVHMAEEEDLAVIRIKHDQALPVVALAEGDSPAEGAQCFVMGYPLIDRMGATIKITQGIVSGKGRGTKLGIDIVVDAKVNPGNSGGPLLNDRGQVIGIVTMKSRSTATDDSYGLAISAGRIRRFLEGIDVAVGGVSGSTVPLTPEEIAARLKPSTVCILSVR